VAKPTGSLCNLNCEYCFYLEKQALFESGEQHGMTDDVLRAFIGGYISSQPTPVVERSANTLSAQQNLRLAGPADLKSAEEHIDVTPWPVLSEEYGDFLIAICEEWVRNDVTGFRDEL